MISTLLPDDSIDSSQLYFNWAMRERLRDKLHYPLLTLTQPGDRHFYSLQYPRSVFFILLARNEKLFV